MKVTVPMNAAGIVTIPAEIRSHLGMEGAGQFELELIEDALVLRPTTGTLDEDAWAYTPEHRDLLERAHRDSRAGRVQRLTEAELEQIAENAGGVRAQDSVPGHVTAR
jgi:AbrB family looped-hinge helix DNA binding protein